METAFLDLRKFPKSSAVKPAGNLIAFISFWFFIPLCQPRVLKFIFYIMLKPCQTFLNLLFRINLNKIGFGKYKNFYYIYIQKPCQKIKMKFDN
jgi:hypothetical protein